ncbi:MAG TPA: DUF3800 domain-containing protein, partial [Sulfuricurvum sp.]|nr:DUF3800 domain-containing protein [Sulfuricurvum sp.]
AIFYVNPIYYFELQKIDTEDKQLILEFINGFRSDYSETTNIEFAINENIHQSNIGDAVYIFVDESGDMDFSTKGSKHYMFNFLVKTRPFQLHEYIANYRYELIERNLDPFVKEVLDIEAFHACEDNKYIRQKMFETISTFTKEAVQVYSYILEKPKVHPEKRKERSIFYVDNLMFAITQLLDKIHINRNFIIITDRLPVLANKNAQIKALKKGIKQYLKTNGKDLRYTIHHHCSASSSNLQIIDYIGWAVNRKYEHGDPSYYEMIKQYLLEEEVMTRDRVEVHY